MSLIDKRPRLLPFVDSEIGDALAYHMRENRVTLRLGEEVSAIEPIDTAQGERVRIHLASGKQLTSEKALYSIGRTGATHSLNLEAAGVTPDDRGRIKVNENYQTEVPHIYGAGDVIGVPQPGFHVDGAGTPGSLSRTGRRDPERARAVPLRHLHHPRDLDGWF